MQGHTPTSCRCESSSDACPPKHDLSAVAAGGSAKEGDLKIDDEEGVADFDAARRDWPLHVRHSGATGAGHFNRHGREGRSIRRLRNVHSARGDDGRTDDEGRRRGLRVSHRGCAGEDAVADKGSNNDLSILA